MSVNVKADGTLYSLAEAGDSTKVFYTTADGGSYPTGLSQRSFAVAMPANAKSIKGVLLDTATANPQTYSVVARDWSLSGTTLTLTVAFYNGGSAAFNPWFHLAVFYS